MNYQVLPHSKNHKFVSFLIKDEKDKKSILINVTSPESLYVTINGKTIYIELSEATDNKFYTSKF